MPTKENSRGEVFYRDCDVLVECQNDRLEIFTVKYTSNYLVYLAGFEEPIGRESCYEVDSILLNTFLNSIK